MMTPDDYDSNQKQSRVKSGVTSRSPTLSRRSSGNSVLNYVGNRQQYIFVVLLGVILLNILTMSASSSGKSPDGFESAPVPVRSGLEYYRQQSMLSTVKNRVKRRLTPLENQKPITIVTRLSGDVTDWLQSVAKTRAVQLRLKERGIPSIIRYQVKQNNNDPLTTISKCFPNLEQDFATGKKNSPSSPDATHRRLASSLIKRKTFKKLRLKKTSDAANSVATKPMFEALVDERKAWLTKASNSTSGITFPDFTPGLTPTEEEHLLDSLYTYLSNHDSTASDSNSKMSLPFILVSARASPRDYNDYYGELRSLLEYNDEKCCGTFEPSSDKTVVYYSGRKQYSIMDTFKTTSLQQSEVQDLSIAKLKNELLANTTGPVAIIAPNTEIVDSLGSDVIAVRHIEVEGRDVSKTEQDFCYLKNTKKELIGHGLSSMVHMAAFLSTYEPKVKLYSVRESLEDGEYRFFHFSKKELNARYTSTSYQAEELDKIHANLMNQG